MASDYKSIELENGGSADVESQANKRSPVVKSEVCGQGEIQSLPVRIC